MADPTRLRSWWALTSYCAWLVMWVVGGLSVVSAVGVVSYQLGAAHVPEAPTAGPEQKANLEVQKLQLEVAKLQRDSGGVPAWATGLVVGLATGFLSVAGSIWLASLARRGGRDQSLHNERLRCYPKLVQATARLALYFPGEPFPLRPFECADMGRALSRWYFENGLLLSEEARNAYFRFALALTRAARADTLAAPRFPDDAELISYKQVEKYREALKLGAINDATVKDWKFGPGADETQPAADRFKDFVFLQALSSRLRTALTEDLNSRRRPI